VFSIYAIKGEKVCPISSAVRASDCSTQVTTITRSIVRIGDRAHLLTIRFLLALSSNKCFYIVRFHYLKEHSSLARVLLSHVSFEGAVPQSGAVENLMKA